MESLSCLFSDVNPTCTNITETTKSEHIIQEGIGGTLNHSKILCDCCNHYFSEIIDRRIVEFYKPIIMIISPLMSGSAKKAIMDLPYSPNSLPLRMNPGGMLNMKKGINKKYNNNGKLKQIIASKASVDKDILIEIAEKNRVPKDSYEINETSLSKHLGKSEYMFPPILIDKWLFKSVVLDILELMRYATLKCGSPDIARSDCLFGLRSWVRNDLKGFRLQEIPFADLSDILDPFFTPATFSHRIIISYDNDSKTLALVAQFVNTMAWLITIKNVNPYPDPISILYQKSLLGGNDQFFTENHAVLNTDTIIWRTFSKATKEAVSFAWRKFFQTWQEQYHRAVYETDMLDDKKLYEQLIHYINSSYPEISAVCNLIERRYKKNLSLNKILEITKQKADSLWENYFPEYSDNKNNILRLYRDCLKYIAIDCGYGFPKTMSDFDFQRETD